MIGSIRRTKTLKDFPRTNNETELSDLRETIQSWSYLKLGLDEHPATAAARIEIGQKITGLKRALVESGLYEYRIAEFFEA